MKQSNIHHITEQLPPTILTIFGATGDLTADYLMPALLHMDTHGLLPKNFRLVAVGRRELNTKSYLEFILKKSSGLKKISSKEKAHFLKHLLYYKGDLGNPESFKPLAKELSDHDQPKHLCYNRLYYFATSPQLFASITRVLQHSGLLTACDAHERKVRILVEKPFGFNLKSAQALNRLLLKYFTEEQIYRIDHYQGKETVQNLMVVRFANSIFEPLWNSRHIDHVEISVLEKDTAKARAEFYDQTGALKDFVQNHILQMLALLTMDEPKDLSAENIRDEKLKILQALVPFRPNLSPALPSSNFAKASSDLREGEGGLQLSKAAEPLSPVEERVGERSQSWIVKGQYQGYKKDVKNPQSQTETYVALKAFINTPRWKDVPFYLRTGKALSKKVAEVSVHFKEPIKCIFKGCSPNVLTFRIQPDESVHLRLNNKVPGFGINLHQGDYEFGYQKEFMSEIPSAYERLLLDFLEGDQRLFIRSDEIEAAWKFIDSVTDSWNSLPLYSYKPKSNGPAEADKFMEKDLKEWQTK